LNPAKNEEQIKKSGQSDGGASGEFVFFSHDRRLFIKTMTAEEFDIAAAPEGDFLWRYHRHLTENPKSLISKIFGIFTIQFTYMDEKGGDKKYSEPFHLMVLENLANLNEKQWGEMVYSAYDIKGSTNSRAKYKKEKDIEDKLVKYC